MEVLLLDVVFELISCLISLIYDLVRVKADKRTNGRNRDEVYGAVEVSPVNPNKINNNAIMNVVHNEVSLML